MTNEEIKKYLEQYEEEINNVLIGQGFSLKRIIKVQDYSNGLIPVRTEIKGLHTDVIDTTLEISFDPDLVSDGSGFVMKYPLGISIDFKSLTPNLTYANLLKHYLFCVEEERLKKLIPRKSIAEHLKRLLRLSIEDDEKKALMRKLFYGTTYEVFAPDELKDIFLFSED